MRIMLANVPLTLGPRFPIPSVIRDKGRDMPLGLLYLGASLKQSGYNDVRVLDVHSLQLSPEVAAKRIIDYRPDLLCLTMYSFSCRDVALLCEIIRNELPDCHISLGGPHPTQYPELTLSGIWCDSICIGYGEQAIVRLAKSVEKNRIPFEVPGIGFKDESGQSMGFTPPAAIGDQDTLPFPDRSLVDAGVYTSWIVDRPMLSTAMMTSRGCPFGCIFCTQSRAPFAQRSPENAVQEVEQCRDMGFKMINFEDDCMNLRREWILEFTEKMRRINRPPNWGFRGRVQDFDDEIALACRDSGCLRVNFGVESGDDEVQKAIGKGITVDQVKQAVQAAKKAGLSTVCYFILGFPDETEEQMKRTRNFARDLAPDFAQFTPLVLLPGTPLYEREKNIRGPGYDPFAEFTKKPMVKFRPPAPTGRVPRRRVYTFVRLSYLYYYFNPRFLFSGKGSKGGFWRGIKAGLSLFSYVIFGPRAWKEER